MGGETAVDARAALDVADRDAVEARQRERLGGSLDQRPAGGLRLRLPVAIGVQQFRERDVEAGVGLLGDDFIVRRYTPKAKKNSSYGMYFSK
jgi:hypothetical protein